MESNSTQTSTQTDNRYDSYEPRHHDVLRSWCDDKKYVVEELLGRGSYGTVAKCRSSTGSGKDEEVKVAVKVAPREHRNVAMTEVDMLKAIRQSEDGNEYLIELIGVFMHKRQVCMVLEMMEMSLDRYVYEATAGRHLDLAEIRRVLHDVLMGLTKLQEMGIIHADMSPANVMLKNCGQQAETLRAKIIDFGLAHLASEQSSNPMIQTQYYRSPEVIMHCLPYCEAIDVWSVGCMMGELLTKRRLYNGTCEYDQIRYMVEHQGLPSLNMIEQGLRSPLYFTKATDRSPLRLKTAKEFLATVSDDGYEKITEGMLVYERDNIVHHNMRIISESMPMYLEGDDMQAELSDRLQAFDLFEALLKLDPQQRISASKAVQHQFFQMEHLRPFNDSSERVRDTVLNA